MKGKFKLLGHIGLVLFLVCALTLIAAPVAQAATEVSEVWVEFPFTDDVNDYSDTDSTNVYIIHFKATTALSRGVDYVTVTWPDGSTTMGGDGTIGGDYSFTVSTLAAADVLFSTNYDTTDLINVASWTATTKTPVIGGQRAKTLLPIDVSAGQDVWVKFDDNDDGGAIVSAATEADTYKLYVATTKDTTPVLSTAFTIGDSGAALTDVSTSYPVPTTAGAEAEYIIEFTPAANVTGTSGTVTVKFPVGTVLPSSISATNVQFNTGGGSYSPCSETPVVDTDRRMITAIPSVTLTGTAAATMKILAAAGITNPKTADATNYKVAVRTSADGHWDVADNAHEITFGSATQVLVANGEIGKATDRCSDDATMINMWSSQIWVCLADSNGNGVTPSSTKTLNLISSSSTGSFARNSEADTSGTWTTGVTSTTIDATDSYDPNANPTTQIFYYRDSTPGTHTLSFEVGGYATAEWEITVCPGVSVYDSSNALVSTYAATSSSPVSETDSSGTYTQYYAGDYINSAITAAITGDTVKLGDGIYELDAYINLNEKITLTSVSGASSTTIRPACEALTTPYVGQDMAVVIGITGTAANPVVVDGLTFTRLRYGTEFDIGVYNNGYNYVTVQNCTFDYIVPDDSPVVSDNEHGSVLQFIAYPQESGGGDDHITAGTISNNTFTNCCSFALSTWGEAPGNISVMAKSEAEQTRKSISGVTVSGNTITNCNGHGIWLRGYDSTNAVVTASVTDNTVTNAVCPITLGGTTTGCSILRNTVSGGYMNGLWVGFTDHDSLVVKNNTFTGCAGTGTPSMDYPCVILMYDDGGDGDDDTVNTVQYNSIYDNDATYSIYAVSSIVGAQDCKYNWYGDASGPSYSALTGAVVSKSNPNGTGAQITDEVTYYPWLHKSLADVVADNVSYQTSTIKLVSGWNTMSTPVKLISAADTVNELIPSGMSIGYYYDGGWQLITTGYTLSPCDAVYVKMSESKYVQFKFDAAAFSTPSKDLAVGWNLISLASLTSGGIDADDTVASVYLTAANLPGYSHVVSPSLNATQYDMYYTAGTSWTVSRAQNTTDTDHMLPGLGYWIYMQNAATLAGFEITPIAPDLD